MQKYVGSLLILLPAVLLLAAFATSAFAAHPHFVAASVALQGPNLVVTSQESGLGNTRGASLTYSVTGSVIGTYSCGTVQQQSQGAQIQALPSTFPSHNGTVKHTSILALPALTSPCATDQTSTLTQIRVHVTVTDQSNNNVNISTSGTFPVPH